MKITGEATLVAPVDRVWDAVLDPRVLDHRVEDGHGAAVEPRDADSEGELAEGAADERGEESDLDE